MASHIPVRVEAWLVCILMLGLLCFWIFMDWFLIAYLFALSGISYGGPVLDVRSAQTSAQCDPSYDWAQNSMQLTPCLVASVILRPCTTAGSDWNIPALRNDSHYTIPNSTTANVCSCSWAAYNLLSACTACQGFTTSIESWLVYSGGCSSFGSTSYLPSKVIYPANFTLPFWAGKDPSTWSNQMFDVSEATSLAQEHPDNIVLQPVLLETKSWVPIIVGGIVGGLVLAALLVGATFLIKRRRKSSASKHVHHDSATQIRLLDEPVQYQSVPLTFGSSQISREPDQQVRQQVTFSGSRRPLRNSITPFILQPDSGTPTPTHSRKQSASSDQELTSQSIITSPTPQSSTRRPSDSRRRPETRHSTIMLLNDYVDRALVALAAPNDTPDTSGSNENSDDSLPPYMQDPFTELRTIHENPEVDSRGIALTPRLSIPDTAERPATHAGLLQVPHSGDRAQTPPDSSGRDPFHD